MPSVSSLMRLGCLCLLGCDPFHVDFDALERAERYQAAELTSVSNKSTLTVMTYNIKFGGGRIDFFFDCHGDRVLMKKSEVVKHLVGLAEKIREVDPDVLLLQEVDVASKRSAYVNQLSWLLDHTALNHAVYASQWRADFVPSDGIGAVDSGNAILSKYPITDGTRIALPLRTDQDSLERYFFLRRNLLKAKIDVGTPLWVVVAHTSAYSQDGTKRKQIERFKDELDSLSQAALVLGGGDLNTLPPSTLQTSEFDDSVCEDESFQADDYREETDWLAPVFDSYAAAIPLENYAADNARYFTHTTDRRGAWNRKLDYLFTSGAFKAESGLVHQGGRDDELDTKQLSDHAPVSARLELP